MDWHTLAQNPQAVSSLFATPLELDKVLLSEISIHHDGPRLSLSLSTNQLPTRVPSRWQRQPYNRLSIRLDFYEIDDLSISGWGTNNLLSLSINPDSQNSCILINGLYSNVKLSTKCKFFRIAQVEPYLI